MEAVLEGRVKLGALTLNEMRDALGLDPYANAAADRPRVLIAIGYVPIRGEWGWGRRRIRHPDLELAWLDEDEDEADPT